jgi:HEAT repeat protein
LRAELEGRLTGDSPDRQRAQAKLSLRELTNEILRPENDERPRAIEALGKLGAAAADAVPRLASVLRQPDADPDVRQAAMAVLGMLGSTARPAVPALVTALRNHDEPLFFRVKAMELLVSLAGDQPETVTAIADRFRDVSEAGFFRFKAGEVLSGMGSGLEAIFPIVEEALAETSSPELRQVAEGILQRKV